MIIDKLQKLLIVIVIIAGYIRINAQELNNNFSSIEKHSFKKASSSPFLPVSIGIGAILYLINPIVLYENKRIYAGITKEISIGFGNFGEHRVAAEYSLIFAGNLSHHLRFSYKYDILQKPGIMPSNMLQGTPVISVGAGYFTNFDKNGIFPELSYGYSLRNSKVLFYPHIKIRYTFMFKKDAANIADISFGLMIGFANPFTDLKIRRDN
jgi:hypothetical protein